MGYFCRHQNMRLSVLAPFLVISLWQCGSPVKKETKIGALDSTSTLIDNFIQSTNNASAIAIELDQLASQSNNAQIRGFADSEFNYYSGLRDEIQNLAAANNIKLPDSLPLVETEAIKNLKVKKGLDFDRSYVRMMNVVQQIIVTQFSKVSKVRNEGIRQIITSRLPELKTNINDLRNIRNQLSGQPDKNALKRKEKNA
jgi:putative membrane protein